MSNLVLQHSTKDYIPNPYPRGEMPFEEFWRVRSSLLAASIEHGPTGPESDADAASFWLVEDQHNDERYQRMEVYVAEALTVQWLQSLSTGLQEHDGWGISIGGFDGGNLVLFADKIVVIGPMFENCKSIADVATVASQGVASYQERKNGSLANQIKLIERLLPEAMPVARANGFAHLATFDHYQLYNDNAVWMLQTKNDNELYMDTDHGTHHSRAVDANGTINDPYCRDYWPYTDVSPDFWLVVYLNGQRDLTQFRYLDEEQTEVATVSTSAAISTDELDNILAGDP